MKICILYHNNKKRKKENPKDLTESRQSFGSGDPKVISGMLFFLFYDPGKA